MDVSPFPAGPSPAPWLFSEHIYGLAHCLTDRDGRVIGCNLRIENGPLMEQAPAMAALLRDFLHGTASIDMVRSRAAVILRQVERGRERQPGEDDE